jgi:archaellum component FlaC
MLDEAVDSILGGMDKLYDKFKGEMSTRFDNVENRLRNVEVELSHVKDEINGLKTDLSDTPSRKEFEEVKTRIDKRYPLS